MSEQEIGVYTPAVAEDIYQMYLRLRSFRPDARKRSAVWPRDPAIRFKNTYEGTIPAYGCVLITGRTNENDCFFHNVTRPTEFSVVSSFLFNGPREVAEDGYGTAQRGPSFICLNDGSAISAGKRWSPTADSFVLQPGVRYVGFGSDAVTSDTHRVMLEPGQLFAKTKTGGIPANDKAKVLYREPTSTGWQDTAIEFDCWTGDTAVDEDKIILVFEINGRAFGVEFC